MHETDFSDHGFLADDVQAIIQRIAERYVDWIALFREINETAVRAQYTVELHPDAQALLTGALYSRVLSTTQGAALLLMRGMPSQAQMLLRVAVEACLNLFAVANSREFTERYIAADEVERAKFFKRTRRWQAPSLRKIAEGATPEKLAEIEAQIRALDARAIPVEEAAKAAGLHDWYLSVYASLCASVHPNVRDLQDCHMKFDAAGDVLELYNEPETRELHGIFVLASEILLISLRRFSEFFGLEWEAHENAKYSVLRDLCARENLL